MSQAEEIIERELKKAREAKNFIGAELAFIEKWLNSDPGKMEGYLRGRRSALNEILAML